MFSYFKSDISDSPSPASGISAQGRLIKIVLIGEANAGKTQLIDQYVGERTEIGADFKIKRVEVDGEPIRVQLWDTAGQEGYGTGLASVYYRNANAVILVVRPENNSISYAEEMYRYLLTQGFTNDRMLVVSNFNPGVPERSSLTEQEECIRAHFGDMQHFSVFPSIGYDVERAFMAAIRLGLSGIALRPTPVPGFGR